MWPFRYLFDISNTGLYRDDGLILLGTKSPRNIDKTRKEFKIFFKDNGLNINTVTNAEVINFLNVTLDINSG